MPRVKKQQQSPTFVRRVRIFFARFNKREVLTFLCFVLISTVFWMALSAYQDSDRTYTVHLRIENQPASYVFTTYVPEELQVTVVDKNMDLMRFNYSRDLDSLKVDFSRYADASGNFRISGAELQSLLLGHLASSTQITAIQPALIDARFAVTEGKMIPVQLNADLIPATNYRIHTAVLSPDSVWVHAPSSILDTLTCINTKFIKGYAIDKPIDQDIELDLPIGLKATPASVMLNIKVINYVEKEVRDLPIKVLNVPEHTTVEVFPNKARISCLIDFDNFRSLTPEIIEVSVDYADILSRDQRKLPVDAFLSRLDNETVTNMKVWPDSVEFVIIQE